MDSSILPIDGTLIGTTNLGWSGPRSNGNDEVVHFPQTLGQDSSHRFSVITNTPKLWWLLSDR